MQAGRHYGRERRRFRRLRRQSSSFALYSPGQNVWALSLMRDIPIHERMKFTFRADATNASNHPQFSGLNYNSPTIRGQDTCSQQF